MKFADYKFFEKIFEDSDGDTDKIFAEVTRKYIENRSKRFVDDKVNFVLNAADSIASLDDPSNKIKKAKRELFYNPASMGTLKEQIMKSLGSRGGRPFELLWDSLKKSLNRLMETNQTDYDKIYNELTAARAERTFELPDVKGKFNLLEKMKSTLALGSEAEDFLQDLYALKVQIGKNPPGKGEYLIDLLVRDASPGSDVKIYDTEYELKTTGGAVGEPLGSKLDFQNEVKKIFADTGDEMLEKMSFGKKDYHNWSKFFREFTLEEKNKKRAKDFLMFQCSFVLREVDSSFIELIDSYVSTPQSSTLTEIYDKVCRAYVKKALREDKSPDTSSVDNTPTSNLKSMFIFDEKSRGGQSVWTGDVFVFDYDQIDDVVVFAGNEEYKDKVRIGLSKGNNTGSRPDVSGI